MQTLVRPLSADAAITVNYGSNATCTGPGDPNEAAAWVNYANNTQHYGVKYWTVGNEQYNQETDLDNPPYLPTTYANRVATQFYPLMKAQDPTILVGVDMAFGGPPYNTSSDTWDPIVLANAKYDFVEMHYYPESPSTSDDTQLLTTWSNQAAANFSTARSLLAANGHAEYQYSSASLIANLRASLVTVQFQLWTLSSMLLSLPKLRKPEAY
jgi:alpha-L-arabinofuranosidase